MSSTTSLAISSAALATSAAAEGQAREAKKVACTGLMQNYKHTGDVTAAKTYAECVQLVYPDDVQVPQAVKMGVLAAVVIAVLIGIYGAVHEDAESGVAFFLLAGLAEFVIALLIAACWWALS